MCTIITQTGIYYCNIVVAVLLEYSLQRYGKSLYHIATNDNAFWPILGLHVTLYYAIYFFNLLFSLIKRRDFNGDCTGLELIVRYKSMRYDRHSHNYHWLHQEFTKNSHALLWQCTMLRFAVSVSYQREVRQPCAYLLNQYFIKLAFIQTLLRD